MSEFEIKNKRWYDLDPTVSLAVKLFENSDENMKNKIADYIINEAKNRGVKIKMKSYLRPWSILK